MPQELYKTFKVVVQLIEQSLVQRSRGAGCLSMVCIVVFSAGRPFAIKNTWILCANSDFLLYYKL